MRLLGRTTVLMSVILMLGAGCAAPSDMSGKNTGNGMGDVIYDQLYTTPEKEAKLTVFRCGDTYLTLADGESRWLMVEGTVPSKLRLKDGEFAAITADIVRMYGGVAGFGGNPSIEKVHSFEKCSIEDVAESGLLEEYVLGESNHGGPHLCKKDDESYCIAPEGSGYRVYQETKLVGVYDTAFEAEAAMGFRKQPDLSYDLEEVHSMPLYVFHCNGRILAYCNYIDTNGKWVELFNADMENQTPGFVLKDGEIVGIERADFIKVSDGENVIAVMLAKDVETKAISYSALVMHTAPEHWEESAPAANGEWRQYHSGDYLIFYFEGEYVVYHDNGETQELIGTCRTPDEVDRILGR